MKKKELKLKQAQLEEFVRTEAEIYKIYCRKLDEFHRAEQSLMVIRDKNLTLRNQIERLSK